MEDNRNQQQIIDLRKIFHVLLDKRKVFYKLWLTVFVLSCIWILLQPSYYVCDVKLAPENSMSTSKLSNLATSFGIKIGTGMNNDAIPPLLYPDLFKSPEFLVNLYDIQIRTADGKISTDYYTYRQMKKKSNPLMFPFMMVKGWLLDLMSPEESPVVQVVQGGASRGGSKSGIDPFCMSEKDFKRMMAISSDINCSVDKKTDVITLSVWDQDRLVCAMMADSIKMRLQAFITSYRTQKARDDVEYYRNQVLLAEEDYEESLRAYSDYVDSHSRMTRQNQMNEAGRLKNEMQLELNTYNVLMTQLSAAEAKVQEDTPAFTTLKSATVPARPARPRKKMFVMGMLIFSTIVASCWMARKELFGEF